jgi:hypothetical protein
VAAVDLTLGSDAGEGVTQAVRTAIVRAGVELVQYPTAERSAWWSAGLAEAVERGLPQGDGPSPYDVARSPRSTRGATRA